MPSEDRSGRFPDVFRLYALSAAAWGLFAATSILWALAGLALAWSSPLPALGFGRLSVAGLLASSLGAVSLALAGAWLRLGTEVSPRVDQPRSAWIALGLWNVGLALAVGSALGAGASAEPLAPPLVPGLALWVSAFLWLLAIWRNALTTSESPGVGQWFGLLAAVGLLASLSVGLLVPLLGGVGQAIAGAVYARSLLALWVAPGGIGLAAIRMPWAVHRPLYGRRLAVAAWASWLVLVPLSMARDLPGDLFGGWPSRIVLACGVLQGIPALLCLVLIAGTLVGAERRRPGGEAAFLLLGVAATALGMMSEAALLAGLGPVVQFTAWNSVAPVPPIWPASWLLAIGASYLAAGVKPAAPVPIRPSHHLLAAMLTAAVLIAPRGPIGLAEIAGGAEAWLAEGSSAVVRAGAALTLPGCALLWFVAWVWLANMLAVRRAQPASALDRPSGQVTALPGSVVAWASVTGIAFGLLGSLFVPLSQPAAPPPAGRATDRAPLPGGSRARGQAVYLREGCVICHSQRVRPGQLDRPYGRPTVPADYGSGPALAGLRRWGPDLAWAGDRYPDRFALARRLAVHGRQGAPSFPWLFGPDGTTADGDAVVEPGS